MVKALLILRKRDFKFKRFIDLINVWVPIYHSDPDLSIDTDQHRYGSLRTIFDQPIDPPRLAARL
jgi:hypothetical protein